MSDRDQHVDRLLREAMAGPVRAESGDCLDIETLAAWSEGSLRADDRARAEAHAARCTRCQSMLAAMIRTEPVVAAAAPSPFRKWLMILGPALGAAAAVALWFAVDPQTTRPTSVDTVARLEQAPRPASQPAPVDHAPVQEERKALAAPTGAPGTAPAMPSAPAISSPRGREADKSFADAVQGRDADAMRKTRDRSADAKEKTRDDSRNVIGGLPAPPAPPPPPPAAPEPPRAQATLDRAQAERVQSETVTQNANQRQVSQQPVQSLPSPSQSAAQQNVTQQNTAPTARQAQGERRENETAAAAAPPPTITEVNQPKRDAFVGGASGQGAGRAGGVASGIGTGVAGGTAAGGVRGVAETLGPASTIDVPAATPSSTRYRALFGRNIQRSTDGGVTWTTVRMLPAPTTVVAGASPSPTVCWLAASGGLVLTTNDGVTWREAKLPESGEITSITAVNANTATVTMTDGRTLTTSNAGTSWARPR